MTAGVWAGVLVIYLGAATLYRSARGARYAREDELGQTPGPLRSFLQNRQGAKALTRVYRISGLVLIAIGATVLLASLIVKAFS